ncbi:MAG: PP2C family protein-serine/threonine phosphatase [Planctomycetota bacterium]|nr:PP2C family protein-serine/threonine phosphatase [Planctomycetota bacterium]
MADSSNPRPGGEGQSTLEAEGLQNLLDVTRRINAAVDLDAVLDTIVDCLVSLVRADRGFLMMRDDEGELRFTIARDKTGKPLEEKKFRVSQGVVSEVAETGETRLIDDAASSDAYQARMSIISLSLRTILCVPLKTAQGVIGVIYVDSNAITRRFTEQDVPLIEAFASQAAATLERVRLEQAERERDRMRQQLEVASEIQRTFLPSEFPALERVQGSVASVPALHVGGDFYDVIRLPGGRVGVMVGDVSGKGVPGALFGARLMSDVRYQALYHDDVAKTLTAVNQIVAERVTRGMFVTFLYAVFDPENGSIVYGNAGHLPPLIRRADGTLEEWRKPSGLPLGIFATETYEAGRGTLEQGDTLLILSDGLGDAVGPDGTRFSDERVHEVVAATPGGPGAIVTAICDATAAHTGNQPQADDQTLLAISPA